MKIGIFLCILFPLFGYGQVLESNLPVIVINTEGNTIVNEPKVLAGMGIIDNGPGNVNRSDDPYNDYDGVIGIEFRGSSSQSFPKKNYGIELRKVGEQDTSLSLLGLPAEEDWVLHGPYSDKSQMRNVLTFALWKHTGRYGSRFRYVELIINNDYKGLYVLMENVKRDGDRVDIARLQADENSGDDLTGGYIIKLDKFDGTVSGDGFPSLYEPPGRTSPEQQIYFQYDYPRGDEITPQQETYIRDYVRGFEDALNSGKFTDPVTGYQAWADMNSFVDYAILNEMTRNVDGYRLSTFLYKDKDSNGGLLHIGPPWDYNLAWGNANYCDGSAISGWAWDFNKVCDGDFWLIPFWWDRFLRDPAFVQRLNERWTALRSGPYATNRVHAYIDSLAAALDQPIQRNFERWGYLGEYVWPNNFVGQTYDEEVNYLKDWLSQRLNWLDANFPSLLAITSTSPERFPAIQAYPNPVTDFLRIAGTVGIARVEIRDMGGRLLISEENVTGPVEVDTRFLARGVYLLTVRQQDGGLRTVKILK